MLSQRGYRSICPVCDPAIMVEKVMIRNWVYTDTTGLRRSRFWQTVAVLALLAAGYLGSNLDNPSGALQQAEEPSRVVVQAGEAGKTAMKSNKESSPALNLAATGGTAGVNSRPVDRIRQAAWSVPVVGGDPFYLPDGARARLGRGTLRDAVLSENAEYLYVAGSIGVFAHRVGDFSEAWKVITDEPVGGLNVSPDGNFLAYFINNQVRILEAKTGEHISTFKAGEIEIRAVVFDPGSAHLAVQSDYTVSLWSLARAELVNKYLHESGISAIAWSGDGDRLAIGDSQVLVWDPWGEAVEASETGMEGTITDLVWSQEASLVVAGLASGGLEIWNIDSGETLVTESGHDLWVSSLDVSPESNLVASGGKDGRIVFWDGRSGEIKKSIPAHQSRVARVAFLLDGQQLLSAGLDGRIAIWDVGSGEGDPDL